MTNADRNYKAGYEAAKAGKLVSVCPFTSPKRGRASGAEIWWKLGYGAYRNEAK